MTAVLRPPMHAKPTDRPPLENELADSFKLVSIRPVAAPSGMIGPSWQRYEIAQGPNTIVGYRPGRIDTVKFAVEAIVEQLNERRTYGRSRAQTAPERGRKGSPSK